MLGNVHTWQNSRRLNERQTGRHRRRARAQGLLPAELDGVKAQDSLGQVFWGVATVGCSPTNFDISLKSKESSTMFA